MAARGAGLLLRLALVLAGSLRAAAQLPAATQQGFGAASIGAGQFAPPPPIGRPAAQNGAEAIASLMQRFERAQPQLQRLPQTEVSGIVGNAQQLHERFVGLQQKFREAELAGITRPSPGDEAKVASFVQDLRTFVERVEGRLGITESGMQGFAQGAGPLGGGVVGGGGVSGFGSAAPGIGGNAMGAGPGMASSPGGQVTPATDRRLQSVMNTIVNNMRRFEALHPQLRQLPQQSFSDIASRSQQLHEEFLFLQQRGTQLAGDGRSPMSEADALLYAERSEKFAAAQGALIEDVERRLQERLSAGGMPVGGGASGFGGVGGFGAPPPLGAASAPPLGAATAPPLGAAAVPPFGAAGPTPGVGFGAGGARFGADTGIGGAGGAGQVTPATDRRLSEVVRRVTDTMSEFEGLRPQIGRLPAQAFDVVARQGQQLQDRFAALQQRGAQLAGDGTRPMSERDASSFAADMEDFQRDQAAFVDQTRQAIASGGGGAVGGAFGGAGLPPASPSSGAMPSMGGSFGSFGAGSSASSSGGLGGAFAPPAASFGAARATPGAATAAAVPPPSWGEVREQLADFAEVSLDTSVLPAAGSVG
eukprot:TRINITY_DN30032_c0_g1_i1.p1 TRINITY_DN30032_c0_g1~~TRINITY_DN30032_c0_g1_i1.p1  ORF type:complete len:608 (+),score=146.69 TRINITY_DN30032_c0_g1_i1:52-1824(+)